MASISAAPTTSSTTNKSKTSGTAAAQKAGSSSTTTTASSSSAQPHKRNSEMSGTAGHRPSAATASAAVASTDAGAAAPPSPSVDAAQENISYSAERIIGNGSFGVVFEAKVVETNEVVAIKKVLQDKRFKNRELQIMRQLVKDPHTNIVALKHCFYSQVSCNIN